MSLRTRLLIAIGVIAAVALTLADVATYRYLESYLYQQADQQLELTHGRFEAAANSGRSISGSVCYAPGPFAPPPDGGASPSGDPDGGGPRSNVTGAVAVEVRSPSGGVVNGQSCPAYVESTPYLPLIPTNITGFSNAEDGTRVGLLRRPVDQVGRPGVPGPGLDAPQRGSAHRGPTGH